MTTVELTPDVISSLPEKPAAYRLGRGEIGFFVGCAENLQAQVTEHVQNERNSCLRRKEPDTLIYEVCYSTSEAQRLASDWYRKGGHDCNEIALA